MKTSSPTTPKPPEPKSILFIGPPGSAKTTLMLQFPKLLVIDCDRNLDGPERFLRHGFRGKPAINPDLNYAIETIDVDDSGKEVKLGDRFNRLISILNSIPTKPEYRDFLTVGIDGLTVIGELIKFNIYDQQKSDHMEARDWDRYKSKMWHLVVRALKSLNKTTIITCHETILTKVNSTNFMVEEVIGFRPTVQGGIADYFSGLFTDAWRFTMDSAPGDKLEVELETTKNKKSPHLKNSLGLPTVMTNPTYSQLAPYFNGTHQ